MNTPTVLTPVLSIVWVLVGILLSLVLPLAVKVLNNARAKLEGIQKKPTFWERLKEAWVKYGGKTYVYILLAATLVAVVIVFLLGLEFSTAREAAMAGFAWESLINKLFGKQNG
jgi:hypothetical protein